MKTAVLGGVPQALSGGEAIEAARQLAARKFDVSLYAHLFLPAAAVPIHQVGVVAVPEAGPDNAVTVVSYQVPRGMVFWLHRIINDFQGAFQPGDSLWTLYSQYSPGTGNYQMSPKQGLVNVPLRLGAFQLNQYEIGPYRFAALDLVSIVAQNVNLPAGAPNFYASMLRGFALPAESSV